MTTSNVERGRVEDALAPFYAGDTDTTEDVGDPPDPDHDPKPPMTGPPPAEPMAGDGPPPLRPDADDEDPPPPTRTEP